MDPIVTARVPAGIRDRGTSILHEIGSNTTELINAAFNYVIQTKELPKPMKQIDSADDKRKLSESQRDDLESFMRAVNVHTPANWEKESFETLLDKAMGERYASLR